MTAETQVDTLEAKGLIRLATVQPEIEYLFRHALVQDAAYGSLLKQERRGLHAQVGEALEELYPDRREELAAVLAMHFEQAGETDKAIDYLVAAGHYGAKRNAIREAYDAFDRAAALLPSRDVARDPAMRRRDAEIRLGKVAAGFSFLPAEEINAGLDALVPDIEATGDDQLAAKVYELIAMTRLQTGEDPNSPPVKRSLERMHEIGERLGDPSLQALPMAIVGMNNVFAGSVREGVAQLSEALPQLGDGPGSIAIAFARGALAVGLATLGEFDAAAEAARTATEIAERGDVIAQLDAKIMDSMVRSLRGDLESAMPLARECVDLAEGTGAAACVMASSWVLGDAFHRLGEFAQARDILARGAEVSDVVDRKVWRPTLHAWLRTSAAALEGTDADLDEALETARSIGNRGGEAGILVKRAEVAARGGDIDAAARDYEASTEIYEAEGARPLLARALRDWGEALRSAGRPDEATPLLRRALALLEELGIDREAAAVRTSLSLGSTTLRLD
ncbi:MAG TPA: tetratricopeptide repeat protein [Candidatus Limnocylindrales bacterium]|nr:tetratricopeptide repeat protein [Candidatus Limnocylindrales bacterium]